MTYKKQLEQVLTDPNYVGGVQWWIRKHDALLAMNLRLVATIPPRPLTNRNRDQESWDAKYSFLENNAVSNFEANTSNDKNHE